MSPDSAENPDEYLRPDDRVMERIGSQSLKYAEALAQHENRAAVIYDDRIQLLAALHFIEISGRRREFMHFAGMVIKATAGTRPQADEPQQIAEPIATEPG